MQEVTLKKGNFKINNLFCQYVEAVDYAHERHGCGFEFH